VRDTIVDVFDDREFDRFLADQLKYDRRKYVANGAFIDVVEEVIRRLMQQGRVWQLIQEVALVRPLRQDVIEIYRKYAEAVLGGAAGAEVDAKVRAAYEGLGLSPPVRVQEHGVPMPGIEAGPVSGLQALVNAGLLNLDTEQWRTLWQRRERCVCRVELAGQPLGTGFLVGPDTLLTNYHVVESVIRKTVSPSQLVFRFGYKKLSNVEISTGATVRAHATNWLVDASDCSTGERAGTPDTPPPTTNDLDFALVRLATDFGNQITAATEGAAVRGWIEVAPASPALRVGMPLLILQHPRTAPLQIGMDTRAVQTCTDARVRYATNTEPGSSGSPCFDFDWNLVALHHYGDPAFNHPRYNQGIPIAAIRARLTRENKAEALGGPPP